MFNEKAPFQELVEARTLQVVPKSVIREAISNLSPKEGPEGPCLFFLDFPL